MMNKNKKVLILIGIILALLPLFFVSKNKSPKINPVGIVNAGNCTVGEEVSLDSYERLMIGLINNFRSGKGLSTLSISSGLNRSATMYANEITENDYQRTNPGLLQTHTDGSGRTVKQRTDDCGYQGSTGENVVNLGDQNADTKVDEAFQAWVNSPVHNAVMSNPIYKAIGIGRAVRPHQTYGKIVYWVTDFGTNFDDSGNQIPAPTVAATPTNSPSPFSTVAPTSRPNSSTTPVPTSIPAGTPTYNSNADLNDDGKIDELDLNILYSGFTKRIGD